MKLMDDISPAEEFRRRLKESGGSPGDMASVLTLIAAVIQSRKADPQYRVKLLEAALDMGIGPDQWALKNSGVKHRSLLAMCVTNDLVDGVRLLLERGVNVRHAASETATVLDLAIGRRSKEVVQLLLDHATLLDAMNLDRFSETEKQVPKYFLIHYTSKVAGADGDDIEIVRMLLDAGLPSKGLLAHACSDACWDFPDAVDLLVAHGCDVNDSANPPLLLAAGSDKPKMVRRLLELGADPAVRTPKGASAMQCAGRHQEVKEVLRSWKTCQTIGDVFHMAEMQGPAPRSAMGVPAL